MAAMIHRSRNRQRGVTLITALIFLTVISVVSISSMRSSTMGVRMAQNEESRFAAIQATQALTEAIIASPASTPVIGGAGFSNCTPGELGCNLYTVAVPAGFVADEVAAGHLSARIERLTPPDKPPPRVLESSVDKFSAASFQLIATFDRTQEGLGRAQLVEGLIVLVPKN
ncbi:MAG: PilX N-terminal domain-containing pilus assembly protein [Gammaproteobacteria bacterium]|nr:PilX N-terminal domain-containing pilus assembly protein [Gammaproteobacteria bacterium]